MPTRTMIVLGFIAGVLAAAGMPTEALAQRNVSVGVSAGLSLPSGEMSDYQASGYHVGGHLNLAPASLPFEVLVDVTYHSFDAKDDAPFAAKFSYLNVSGSAAYAFGGTMTRPYLLGGVGMYMGKADVPGAESESEFGFHLGAGVRFLLSGITSFGQVRLNFVDSHTFIPISFGVLF